MAITYVGGQTAFILGSTTADTTVTFSLTGGLASTPATDDLVVVCVAASRFGGAGVTSLVTTGYTSTTRLTAEDAQDSASQVHYKLMGGTPDTEVVITRSGATDSGQAYTIHVFRGVDLTTPLDVTTTTATGIDTGRPNPAAITPSTAGAWIYIGTGGAAATGAAFTYGDFTAVLSTVCDETSNDAVVGSGYFAGWTSGAYDPAASTTGSTSLNSSWTATTMAFRPAADSGSDLDSDAAASVTWGSGSTAAAGLSCTTLASLTVDGAEVTPAAWSSIASGAAAGGVAGASVSAQPASLTATGTVTWGGAEIVSGFTSAEVSLSATATLEWVGAAIDAQDWRSVARLGFPPSANRWSGASTSDGDWQAGAVAEVTFANASIATASADFSIGATASVSFTGFEVTPFVFNHVVLDGKTPKPYRPEGMDEEDIPLIMAAITTVMENNHVNY